MKPKNINKQKDREASDLQNIKSGAFFLYFDSFYFLILADNIVIYFLLSLYMSIF